MESERNTCCRGGIDLLFVSFRSVDEASFKSALQADERGLPIVPGDDNVSKSYGMADLLPATSSLTARGG